MKKLLKLPKEVPTNIVTISHLNDLLCFCRLSKLMRRRTSMLKSSQLTESRKICKEKQRLTSKNCHFSKVHSFYMFTIFFVDSDSKKWTIIYLAKLRACKMHMADFTDLKKDIDMKDEKKECLIELIDVLDENEATDLISNDKLIQEAFSTIGANLFRTFGNKSKTLSYSEILENKKTSAVEQDEDEPHLEEGWPHLQLVYELLLKFVMSAHVKPDSLLKCLNKSFVKNYLELFDSEDPRERDYLKTILHRIYGKFLAIRPNIKEQIMHLLLRITQEAETHNGLTELLEILGSITCGLAVPLRQEH
jgi:serine/threonine-protein phosphatase 2A regulatory subunit B'